MGTRFLLTSDSPVADAVKQVYLAAALDGTVVTRRVDGVPHRVLRTSMVDQLEGLGRSDRLGARGGRLGARGGGLAGRGGGLAGRGGGLATLARSARNAAKFRGVSGMSWREMLNQAQAMRRDGELSWAQVLMAANTPVLLRAAMVEGRTDLGLMSSGQVVGLITDLPSCAELIEAIIAEAGAVLDRLEGMRKSW
jgi:NAD(P)H-dependent flavin oxidoreductase YrpB (nitropropane dioxygenase family)